MVLVSVITRPLYRRSFLTTTFRIGGLRLMPRWDAIRVGWLIIVAMLDYVGHRRRPTLNGDANDVCYHQGFVVRKSREAHIGPEFNRYGYYFRVRVTKGDRE